MKHIVLYSGGLGSFFTAKRLLERGIAKEDIVLLFTDTKVEDEDLYRFLDETTAYLGIPLTDYSDGRTIWEVMKDHNYFLSNSRVDHCSEDLKRKMSKKYRKQFDPNDVIFYLGFDWTEMHRYERAKKAWLPYRIESPLTEKPYIDKNDMKKMIGELGIEMPRLYKMGFAHNNCGGGCVKAGIGHFTMLLERFPERFKEWEENEQMIRERAGKDVTILRRVVDGEKVKFTLKQLRKEHEANRITQSELFDIGGCGCFIK